MPSVERTRSTRTTRIPAAPTRTRLQPSVATPEQRPDSASVTQRAYELFLARGREHGCDLDDWLRAERELTPTS